MKKLTNIPFQSAYCLQFTPYKESYMHHISFKATLTKDTWKGH